jgi:hypothetical protein
MGTNTGLSGFYSFLAQPLFFRSRLFLAALVVPLLLAFLVPLWRIELSSPQHPQGLTLDVYAHTVKGGHDGADIREINILNQSMGVQALVRLPMVQRRLDLAAGLNTATFISGYPGSPLGGFDLELQRRRGLMDAHHVVHQMGVNEELGATAVMGSQLAMQLPGPRFDGVLGLWYGKANGFDRALDALRQANLAGTVRTGGALALVFGLAAGLAPVWIVASMLAAPSIAWAIGELGHWMN